MDNNYWQEYWKNYFEWMALYLKEVQTSNSMEYIEDEYIDTIKLFAPPMGFDNYVDYLTPDEEYNKNSYDNYDESNFFEADKDNNENKSEPKLTPEGGTFTLNNCKKMKVVKVVMKKNYNPSQFYMIVDRYDNKSVSGYRIACDDGKVKFKALSIEYRDISLLECVF